MMKKISKWCLAALIMAMLIAPVSMVAPQKNVTADQASWAMYMGEDERTFGYWYDRDTVPFTRLYGSEGVVIPLHKVTGDGQSDPKLKDIANVKNFTEESTVNFVEYPDYVNSITTDISSKDFWNYTEVGVGNEPVTEADLDGAGNPNSAYPGALLSANPSLYNRKIIQYQVPGAIRFNIDVNDSAVHKVTVYTSFRSGNGEFLSQYFRLLDRTSGKTLAQVFSKDKREGIYYSFLFKGSVTLEVQNAPGSVFGAISGIFFDSPATNPAYAKTGLQATVEGPKTVNLSWTNGEAAYPVIFRKLKGEDDSKYQIIKNFADDIVLSGTTFPRIKHSATNAAELTSVNTYTDTTAQVAREYVYMIGSAVPDPSYPALVNYQQPTQTAEIQTATYARTSVAFEQDYYALSGISDTVAIKATVHKDVIYDGDTIVNAGVPYEGAEIAFTLDGDLVYDTSQANPAANMETLLFEGVTDADGKIQFTFSSQYSGLFRVIADVALKATVPDESEGYDSCTSTTDVNIPVAAWNGEPYLTHVSDAVKPGENFYIYGTGLSTAGQSLAIAPAVAGHRDYSESIQGLTMLDIALSDIQFENSIIARLPDSFAPGAYDLWVKNAAGWSNCVKLNAARPLFLSQEAAYEGLQLEVVGRNFMGSEFGLPQASFDNTKIKLVGKANGETHLITPLSGVRYTEGQSINGDTVYDSNPYRLTFVVPKVATHQAFELFVANDGVNYTGLTNGQVIDIVAKKTGNAKAAYFGANAGLDPLGLGVYWVQDIKWNQGVEINPDTANSDNNASNDIQAAIDQVNRAGGGVVYLPDGTYKIASPILLKSGVVLVGQSSQGTRLVLNMPSAGTLISSSGDNSGAARLSIALSATSFVPDIYFNFSDESDTSDNVYNRRLKNILLYDVKIESSAEQRYPNHNGSDGSGTDGRGIGIMMNGDKNFVIQKVHISSYTGTIHRGFVNKYVTVRDCVFNHTGEVTHVLASYSFIENTAVLGRNGRISHGISARSDSYISNNRIENVGSPKDSPNNNGEVIMLECPSGQISYGNVLAADARSITIDRLSGLNMTKVDYNDFAIVITDGTGAGQQRYLSIHPQNSYGNQFALRSGERDWDVIPDQTSQFSIYSPNNNTTIFGNVANNCSKSILLYSQVNDALVANNRLYDTEGITLYGAVNSNGVKGTNFFNRIVNNLVEGVSPMTGKGGIGINTGRYTINNAYGGKIGVGTVIKGNTIKNVDSAAEIVDFSEVPAIRGLFIYTHGSYGAIDQSGDITCTIVEGNLVESCEYGVYIDNRTYMTMIDGNIFISIESENDVADIGAELYSILANLSFDANGGVTSLTDGRYIVNTYLPAATREGYTFWGWTDQSGLTGFPDGEPITMSGASNANYIALWKATLTLNLGYDSKTQTLQVLAGAPVAITPASRDGFVFGGWYTDSKLSKAYTGEPAANGMTLYAKWTSAGGCGAGAAELSALLSTVLAAVLVFKKAKSN